MWLIYYILKIYSTFYNCYTFLSLFYELLDHTVHRLVGNSGSPSAFPVTPMVKAYTSILLYCSRTQTKIKLALCNLFRLYHITRLWSQTAFSNDSSGRMCVDNVVESIKQHSLHMRSEETVCKVNKTLSDFK